VSIRIRALDWDDERLYAVYRVQGPQGPEVLVYCKDSMFRQAFPELPLETLGSRVMAHVRHHDAAFAAWRAQGGQLGPAERASVGEVRGALPADADLLRFVQWLRGQGAGLAWGPHAAWWPVQPVAGGAAPLGAPPVAGRPGAAPQGFGGIVAGKGADPSYRLRQAESERPENRAYAADAARKGTIVLAIAIVAILIGFGGAGMVYAKSGREWARVWSQHRYSFSMSALAMIQGGALVYVGVGMRTLRRLEITRWVALGAAVPVNVALLLLGPAGFWAWQTLRDDRAPIVFAD
jgi:hypothetical protein